MCGNVVNVKVPPIWREGYCINKGNSYMRVRAAAWRAERWGKRGERSHAMSRSWCRDLWQATYMASAGANNCGVSYIPNKTVRATSENRRIFKVF